MSRRNQARRATAPFFGLFRPVDPASLVVFRIGFGAVMLWETWRFFHHGWIRMFYIEPEVLFTYVGFDWVRPWPGNGMYVLFGLLGVSSLMILLGALYRVGALLFFVSWSYIFLLDASRYQNHHYLISLLGLLLVLMPLNRSFSVDAWMRPRLRSATLPAWCLWLVRFQIGAVYFFAGVAKLNADWFDGLPLSLWLARMEWPVFAELARERWVALFFSYSGLLLDLFIVPFLLWRRTRLVAYLLIAAFHVTNSQLFHIGIFPWFMLVATLIFFEPSSPRKPLAWIMRTAARPADTGGVACPAASPPGRRPAVVALLALYLAVQLLLPFHHLLYPGNPEWTEEGHRWSWRMKLRDKDGRARFFVTDPGRGETWIVDPETILTGKNLLGVSTHPDLAHQFSRHLARKYRAEGRGDVEVRAVVFDIFNGREPKQLIDHRVDLASTPRRLGRRDWVWRLAEAPGLPPGSSYSTGP